MAFISTIIWGCSQKFAQVAKDGTVIASRVKAQYFCQFLVVVATK